MAKVTYKPAEGEPTTHTQYGITWGPEPVEVTNPAVLARVRGNRYYQVEGDDGQELKTSSTDGGLEAEHRGGGRYVIVHGEGDDDVIKGLTKADADAFNALSDEDKAAYVEANKAPAE